MDITIQPGRLTGTISAIPSKSQAHRALICGAFAKEETQILCPEVNRDIEATASCLQAMGAKVVRTSSGYTVQAGHWAKTATLDCQESGSTLRFLLPICGALGIDATFCLSGRLPQRPLSPLWEEMERMGCSLVRPTGNTLRCTGALRPGAYSICGTVSSQFITGLLFALSLLSGPSTLAITGAIESAPYIQMTLEELGRFGLNFPYEDQTYTILPSLFRSPGVCRIEGDWSNGAFWICAKALGSDITLVNLNPASAQGDRSVTEVLEQLQENCTIDASQIPDLVPVLAVTAGAMHGARFTGTHRLRIKESDRLVTTAGLINSLGGRATICGDDLIVSATGYTGGCVDASGDHRIAMAAAVAATACCDPVTIHGAEAVEKSYPTFWDEYRKLGGKI